LAPDQAREVRDLLDEMNASSPGADGNGS
jgi:hypothetical protein